MSRIEDELTQNMSAQMREMVKNKNDFFQSLHNVENVKRFDSSLEVQKEILKELKGIRAELKQLKWEGLFRDFTQFNARIKNGVLLIVGRKFDAGVDSRRCEGIDFSYEVYIQQTEFISHGTKEIIKNIEYNHKLNEMIREHEQRLVLNSNDTCRNTTPYHYAPEFYFDDDTMLHLDRDLLEYPEIFI